MIADGHALEHEIAGLLRDRDQAQVGGAAAHVADEDEIPTRTFSRQRSPSRSSHA